MESEIIVSKNEIEKAIQELLELAYKGLDLRKRNLRGYPTCDLIACFLDTNEALGNDFANIFGTSKIIPKEYRNNWLRFKTDKFEEKINQIVELICQLEDGKNSDFDGFSKLEGVISNVGLASALIMIFVFKGDENNWIKDKKKELTKSTKLLIDNRNPKKGWPFHLSNNHKGKYTHTLSTWLSLIALEYVPKEIGIEIDNDWKTYLDIIKKEVRDWLLNNSYKEDSYCSWSFKPGENEDYNPVATAQAILALYFAGVTDENNEIIKYSIEYIKNNEDLMTDTGKIYLREELFPTVGDFDSNSHPGTQQCLHALIKFNVPLTDNTVQNLLKKTCEITKKLQPDEAKDLSNCYAFLQPLLLTFMNQGQSERLIKSSTFLKEFQSFVSGAESIDLLGEVDSTYAQIIAKVPNVHLICRDEQDFPILETYGLINYSILDKTCRLDHFNCIIVDKKKALISTNPFKNINQYNYFNCIDGERALDLINQINEITNEKNKSQKSFEEDLSTIVGKKYPNHWNQCMKPNLVNINDKLSNGAILEYFNHNPDYTEAIPETLGFESKENAEKQFAKYGIISRVFTNGTLEKIMKNDIKDDSLVMDESSAYLLLNSPELEGNIKSILVPPVHDLYLLSDIHNRLINEKFDNEMRGRLQKIDGENSDLQINGNYHLSRNEKIAINYAKNRTKSKFGIITNSWEVAKVCIEHDIHVYSLLKFLNKTEETYKMFRIPIDFIKEE